MKEIEQRRKWTKPDGTEVVSIESTPSEGDEDGGQQQKVHDRRGQELAQHL